VFLYTRRFSWRWAPISFSASGCALRMGWAGLSFAGVALAIGFPANVDANVLLGDLMIAPAAHCGGPTLLVKATPCCGPAGKALGYQVALSIPILGFAAWISGEP